MLSVGLRQVWKRFGDTIAIRNLSLEVKGGEFFVLFGPAGAGKTTTLNLIAGLVKPTAGEIHIGERLVNDLAPGQRNVAMAFEDYSLFPHLTVYENLASPLRAPNANISAGEVEARVVRIADMLGIGELVDRRPSQLSGGQKQRTALGRALVKDAEVLLLDEPLAHVDAKIRNELRTEFHRLDALKERTTIYVTHDYMEALSLGDRIGVLDQGQLRQVAPPRQIYQEPVDVFVAQAVGWPQINLVECDIKQQNDDLLLSNPGLNLSFRPTSEAGKALRSCGLDRVLLGIRGQFAHPTSNDAEDVNVILGLVEVFMPLGTMGFLTVKVGSIIFNVVTSPDSRFEHKENIKLKVDERQFIFFDPHSQRNIHYLESE